MKKLIIGLASILIASPVYAHPRVPKNNHLYYYPEKDVMVRKDWKRCKKIKYITRYDEWGWYTERKILPLKECKLNRRLNKHLNDLKIKVIIKD
jgi:hypothetical protein